MLRKLCLLGKIGHCTKELRASFLSTVCTFRTSETNPGNLNSSSFGRFYTIGNEEFKTLLENGGLPPEFRLQCKTFQEYCVLVRKPFLDISTCIKAYASDRPTMKYILYGSPGSGKSLTIGSLVHFGYAQEYVLVHVPWVPLWTRFTKEITESTLRPGFMDHTTNSVIFLSHFRNQNLKLLQKLSLQTEKEYFWSKRESTPAGSDLLEVVDHGISRPIHAAECIYALIAELKSASTQAKCKTMVLMDGVNSMWYATHRIKRADRSIVPPSNLTAFEGFKQAFQSDWSGGVVVCTVDKLAIASEFRESDLPRYLLSKEGWEAFDPFVPVQVDKYTPQEVQTTIDYFLDRKWLQHPDAATEAGRKELEFLSTRNPLTLMQLCNSR